VRAELGPYVDHRAELTGEAIRPTREVYRWWSENGEVAGLLALTLITDALYELLERFSPSPPRGVKYVGGMK